MGYNVTIFEKESQIGGLLTYGIPGFRLPRNITRNITEKIKKMGIEIKTNVELGKDINIKDLINKKYKAIFIAIGADIPSVYNLTDKKTDRIYTANYLLKKYNAKETMENLGDVIVIGGGNVATDVARASIRMGAKSSTIIYRRDITKMPARKIELQEAIEDNVQIIYNTKVIGVDIDRENIKQIKCIHTDSSNGELVDVVDSEYSIKADTIIFAIGLKPDINLLNKQGLTTNEQGLIAIDENNMTNINGVFAGGDVSQKKATVCKAIADGKNTAKKIDIYIKKQNNSI